MTTGIFDLLLHKRDVAYSVKTLREWISRAGLYFVDFDEYEGRHYLNVQNLIEDYHLKKALSSGTKGNMQFIAEILRGRVIKHSFYVSKIDDSVANLLQPFNVLYTYTIPHGLRAQLQDTRNFRKVFNDTIFHAFLSEGYVPINATMQAGRCSRSIRGGKKLNISFKVNQIVQFLINSLIYSTKGISLDLLYTKYVKRWKSGVEKDEFMKIVDEFYRSISDTDLFLLKKQDAKQPPNLYMMHCYQVHSANMRI